MAQGLEGWGGPSGWGGAGAPQTGPNTMQQQRPMAGGVGTAPAAPWRDTGFRSPWAPAPGWGGMGKGPWGGWGGMPSPQGPPPVPQNTGNYGPWNAQQQWMARNSLDPGFGYMSSPQGLINSTLTSPNATSFGGTGPGIADIIGSVAREQQLRNQNPGVPPEWLAMLGQPGAYAQPLGGTSGTLATLLGLVNQANPQAQANWQSALAGALARQGLLSLQ